ncbi:nucleoside-diphosphate kinase [Patescibacteria group bacterium]|nr:nucleoside-diphosphate kinase [Patescibacteria group bacterium]
MVKYEQTLVLIKHDGVARGLIGEIISRFERVGLKIVALKLVNASPDVAQNHYPSTNEWFSNVGERVISEFKEKNLSLIDKFGTEDAIEIGKKIKEWNIEYLMFGPVIAIILEGPNSIKLVRKMIGNTNPSEAIPGTIRGDYSLDAGDVATLYSRPIYNLIHASSSIEDATYEVGLWFTENEIYEYTLANHSVMGLNHKLKK